MSRRAMEGTCLAALVRMAIRQCRAAERQCPRSGPGRPPDYDDWKITVLIVVAVLKKRISKSAQYRYLHEHRRPLMHLLGLKSFPARSTYFDRYRRAYPFFQVAIRVHGQQALAEGIAVPKLVAVDQSKVFAKGPTWNRKDRKAQRVPRGLRGLDRESRWGYSPHHGWVQGYSYEVVVTATRGSPVFPLVASVQTANVKEGKTFGSKIAYLPPNTRYVLADAAYDSNDFADRIETSAERRPNGTKFICAPIRRANYERGSHFGKAEIPIRRRRRRRIEFFDSKFGRRLFGRRKQTVEPFNDWFKNLFDLGTHAWHRGLSNNQTQILAAIFCYQLLVRYNCRRDRRNGQIKWIIDTL